MRELEEMFKNMDEDTAERVCERYKERKEYFGVRVCVKYNPNLTESFKERILKECYRQDLEQGSGTEALSISDCSCYPYFTPEEVEEAREKWYSYLESKGMEVS